MSYFSRFVGSTALGAVMVLSVTAVKPHSAFACSCMASSSPQESLQSAAAVFQGVAADVVPEGAIGYKVTFNNEVVWKGGSGSTVTVRTARDSAACGFNFEEGKRYVVYAYQDEENGLSTTLCSRTHELIAADADVAVLGQGTAVAAQISTTTDSNDGGGRSVARNLLTLGLGLIAIATAIALRAARAPKPPVA